MEDRLTPALYLEMSSLDADAYATRADRVLGLPGVHRATWWANACPDRQDLRPKLPEFPLLGVYEVDEGFTPPPASPDLSGAYCFRRYRRPGQGWLTGRPTLGLLLVLIAPRHADGAQALRDWADFVHIRYIAEAGVPGFGMITPYENVNSAEVPRFMHFYEMETADPETAFQSMVPRVIARLGGGPGTAVFDDWAGHPELRIVYVNTFRRVGERTRA